MKKKLMALALSAVMTVGSVSSVSAANYVGMSTCFSPDGYKVTGATYCSYANTSDYTVVVFTTATDTAGNVQSFGDTSYGGASRDAKEALVYEKKAKSGKKWKKASSLHNVFYKGQNIYSKKTSRTR